MNTMIVEAGPLRAMLAGLPPTTQIRLVAGQNGKVEMQAVAGVRPVAPEQRHRPVRRLRPAVGR